VDSFIIVDDQPTHAYYFLQHNFIFRNSFLSNTANKFCLDKDDGPSAYLELNNGRWVRK
jgi:hypothetical protein